LETTSGRELQQILEQNNLDACLRFFSQATEGQRRAVSGIAQAAMPIPGPLGSPFRESRWAELMPAVVERRLERAERWTRWRGAGRTVTPDIDPPKETR
jgi:hypothetical protein